MKVTFTPEKMDLVKVGYVAIRASTVTFWLSVGFFVLLPWLFALVSVVMRSVGLPVGWGSIATLALAPVVAVPLFAFIPVLVTRGARALTGSHTYEFSSAGICMSGPGFQSRMEWSALSDCVFARFAVLFRSGRLATLSIPGRALSETSLAELKSLVAEQGLKVREV